MIIIKWLGKLFRFIFEKKPKKYIDPQEGILKMMQIRDDLNRSTNNYIMYNQTSLLQKREELDYNRLKSNQESIRLIRDTIKRNNIPISAEHYAMLDHLTTSQIIEVNYRLIDILSYQGTDLPALVW